MNKIRTAAFCASLLALFWTTLPGANASGSAGLQRYTYVFRHRVVHVPIGELGRVRYNDVCLKNQGTCQALEAYRSKTPIAWKGSDDPAGSHCLQLKGSELLLTDATGSTSLFCVFRDLSMVDARALLFVHRHNQAVPGDLR